jgi:hypothetical protein
VGDYCTSTTATSRLNIRAMPYTPPHRAAASATPGTVFESMLSDGSSVAAATSGAATRTTGLRDPTIGPMSADRPEPEPEPETEPDPTRRGATSPGAGGTSSAPASAEERLQYQILHTGMKFLEEVWDTAAKPMSEYLHSTADKVADTASTAILEKVKNIRRKYGRRGWHHNAPLRCSER